MLITGKKKRQKLKSVINTRDKSAQNSRNTQLHRNISGHI